MKLSISTRLVLLVALLVAATASTISYYLYKSGTKILVDNALQELSQNLQRDGNLITSHIQELNRDTLFLTATPPIPGLMRAQQNGGYDPQGKSSRQQWLARLSSLFRTMLSTNPDYFQVRLLNAQGQELVKLVRENNIVSVVPQEQLQDKSHRAYFQAAIKLPQGQTYLSPVNLNREFGKISLPHTPVIRCATPVYHQGKLFAVIIINLNFSHQLSRLEKIYSTQEQTLYVTNSYGAYLSHPEPDKRFAFELDHHSRIQQDYPLLADLYDPANHAVSRNIMPDRPDGKIMVFVKIPLNENHPDQFIALSLNRSYSQILTQEARILERNLVIIAMLILLSILFALGFASLVVRPLTQIAHNLESFSSGNKPPLPVKRTDEIGTLARALEAMADNVFSSHQKLRTLNARLEDEVEERTQEVQQNLGLVNAISEAQTAFIRDQNPKMAFELMLGNLLNLSGSEYGFIGEVLYRENDQPGLRIYVTSNIAWDDQTRQFYEDNIENSLEFSNLDNLFGQVILSGETILSNDPAGDPRAAGLPPGHPALNAFLGIPIKHADRLIGMVAIANRPGGYHAELIDRISPFINTCANLILAYQTRIEAARNAQALSETRNELARVISITPVVFYTAEAYGDFAATFISPNIKQQMGYEPHEFTDDPEFWASNIHPDDKERIFAEQDTLFQNGHHTHTYRFMDKYGNYRWMQDELQVIRGQDNKAKELAGYWLDITERKQAELQLQESEQRFRHMADGAPALIWLADTDNMGIWFNKSWLDYTGRTLQQELGLGWTEGLHPDDLAASVEKCNSAFNNREPIEMEFRLKRADGSYGWIADTGIPRFNEDGEFEGYIGYCWDITDRKNAQDSLARFKSTLDQTQDCVFMFSADTMQYFYVNQGAQFLVGYSQEELMQLHPYDINNRTNDAEVLRQFVKPLIDGSRPSLTFETEYRCKDQALVPVEVILQYITHENQAPRFVAMVRDITERRKIDQMKNEFVSTVSHELRTPLTSIRGSLGLLTGGAVGELPDEMQQMLQIASCNTDRLLLLINDILDIQKIESGQMTFHFKPINVMDLLDQAVRDNAAYAEQYNVQFMITRRKEQVYVLGDNDRLIQVLNNLMSNAAKFSPDGDTVELAVAQHGGAIRISVTDHGQGIPEAFQPRLFEQFTQSDASDSRQKGGTGLGLSIAKAIIDKHGGRLDYTTRQGQGTTMLVELPVCKASPPPKTDVPASRLAIHQQRILILEDDPDIAILLKRLLSGAGYHCDIAHNASEARQLLKHNIDYYKAMTLDIQLPDVDGVTFINELRSNPATQSLPVIVVSVAADAARRRLNGGAIGIVDWLDKPINEQRLLNTLGTACQSMSKPKLLHIEDEADVNQIVKSLLQDKAKLNWAKNLQQARHMLANAHYELILLDLSLPDGSGLTLLPEIQQQHPASKLVIYSAHELAPEYMRQVHAVLSKSTTDNDKLLQTIESLLAAN